MTIYVKLKESAVTLNPNFREGVSYLVLSVDHVNGRFLLADTASKDLYYFDMADCIFEGYGNR